MHLSPLPHQWRARCHGTLLFRGTGWSSVTGHRHRVTNCPSSNSEISASQGTLSPVQSTRGGPYRQCQYVLQGKEAVPRKPFLTAELGQLSPCCATFCQINTRRGEEVDENISNPERLAVAKSPCTSVVWDFPKHCTNTETATLLTL